MTKNVDSDAQLASYNTSIRNLEVQLGEISQSLNTHPKGALPSNTVGNPKGGNSSGYVMEVTTSSRRGSDVNASKQKEILRDEVELQEDEIPLSLSINVPLVEALEQMQSYAKFMNNLVTKKISMDIETIKMTYQVSAIVHSMASKLEDLMIVDDTSAMINVEDPLEAVLLNLDVNEDEGRVENKLKWDNLDFYWDEPYLFKICMDGVIRSLSLYKNKINYLHDKYARGKKLKVGDLVLLFNSRLRLFLGKLKSKWSGPFEEVFVTPFGALDLKNKNG
ncbi:uncharacterized protein [Nicotiana sylvestris]|uniref:uncharacterized protein n=1 Tax=Nicotiana sylvestris TaxID=4096 RepID=UPI00388CDEF0